jgi:hypothetical protein
MRILKKKKSDNIVIDVFFIYQKFRHVVAMTSSPTHVLKKALTVFPTNTNFIISGPRSSARGIMGPVTHTRVENVAQ